MNITNEFVPVLTAIKLVIDHIQAELEANGIGSFVIASESEKAKVIINALQ